MSATPKSALLDSLNSIGEAHEFAVSGALDLVLPGLRVEGVGEIGTIWTSIPRTPKGSR